MRFFEVLLLIANAYWLLNFFLKKNKKKEFAASFIAGGSLILVIQLLREGFRWQMCFGYVLMITFVIIAIFNFKDKNNSIQEPRNKLYKILAISAVILILISALLSAYLFPVFSFSEPGGPYSIGKTIFILNDSTSFIQSEFKHENSHQLSINLWYPSDDGLNKSNLEYENYLEAANNEINAPGIPEFLFGYLKYVKTHIIKDAGISKRRSSFPVLIFSPGIKSCDFNNIYLIESLVCQGYLVITLNESNRIVKNERSIVLITTDILKNVIGHLQKISHDQKSKFYGKPDLNKIGIIGYSCGGSAVIKLLSEDDKFKAGVDLNGQYLPGNNGGNITRPFLFMFSNDLYLEKIKSSNDFEKFYRDIKSDTYKLIINGASEYSFTDLPLYSPIFSAKLKNERAHNIISQYVLAFFNKYLKNINSRLLTAPSPDYKEIQFNKKSGNNQPFLMQSPSR